MVLITARPFRVGDRVRLQGGGLAGQIEGVVASLGLLYTTFAQGEDSIMVPNNVVLTSAVVPLREPAAVDLRARLRPDVARATSRRCSSDAVTTPVRDEPHIALEEVDSDEVVVRIAATPESEADGPRLADEVLAAIASVTREGDTTSAWPRGATAATRTPTGIAAAPTAMTAAPTATAPAPTATAPAPTGPAPASCRCSPTAPGAVARGNVTPRRQDVDMVPQGARRWARPWIATASCERCMPTSTARRR